MTKKNLNKKSIDERASETACIHCDSPCYILVEICDKQMWAAAVACTFCGAHGPVMENQNKDHAMEDALKYYHPHSIKGRKHTQLSKQKYSTMYGTTAK